MDAPPSLFNNSTPPLNVALDMPLRVKRETGLYRWLSTNNSMMIGGIISLGQILTLIKMIIGKYKLFDLRNPCIIICNQQLERVFNMRYLHVKQVKEAILESTVLLSYPSYMYHQNPLKNLPAINMPIVVAEQQSDSETDSGMGSDEDESAAPPTECEPTTSIKSEKKDVCPLYWMSAGLRNVLGLSDIPITFHDISSALSKYILARKENLFNSRNIMVAIVENDPLGDVFQVRAFHRDQVTEFLNKHVQQVYDDIAEERRLVVDIKEELNEDDETVASDVARKGIKRCATDFTAGNDGLPIKEEVIEDDETVANDIASKGIKRCATDCNGIEGLPFKKRFLMQDHV